MGLVDAALRQAVAAGTASWYSFLLSALATLRTGVLHSLTSLSVHPFAHPAESLVLDSSRLLKSGEEQLFPASGAHGLHSFNLN